MKKIIVIISSLFACVGLFSFIHFLNSPVRDVTSKAEMIQTDEIKMEYVPTKNQLLKSIGNSVDFLGIYEVTEINFNDTPHIVLTKEDENELSFEIRVTDPKEQSFSIPAIKFSPQNIHVSDTFGIAKKNDRYFAYKNNVSIEGEPYNTR